MGEKPDEVIGAGRDLPVDRPVSTPPAARAADEAMDAASAAQTEEIKAEIEETRAELSETIDAIQERLSPRHLMEQAKDTVKDATVGRVQQMMSSAGETASGMATQTRDAAEQVVERVKDNPIPATLVGLGIGWMLYRATSGSSTRTRTYYGTHEGDRDRYGSRDWEGNSRDEGRRPRGSYGDTPWNVSMYRSVRANPIPAALAGVGIGWLVKNMRSGSGGYAGYGDDYDRRYARYGYQGSESSAEWNTSSERAWDTSAGSSRLGDEQGVSGRISDMADSAGDVANRARAQVSRTASQASDQFDRLLHENPLALGVAALAVGAAVGLTIPASTIEHDWMGEARDSMVDKAQELAHQAKEKVKDTAQGLAQETMGTSKQGSTPATQAQAGEPQSGSAFSR